MLAMAAVSFVACNGNGGNGGDAVAVVGNDETAVEETVTDVILPSHEDEEEEDEVEDINYDQIISWGQLEALNSTTLKLDGIKLIGSKQNYTEVYMQEYKASEPRLEAIPYSFFLGEKISVFASSESDLGNAMILCVPFRPSYENVTIDEAFIENSVLRSHKMGIPADDGSYFNDSISRDNPEGYYDLLFCVDGVPAYRFTLDLVKEYGKE